VYLGYVLSGRDIEIDISNMDTIMKWPVPINCTKFRIFVGETRYLNKFIDLFSAVFSPLHAIIVGIKSL
jgi:hypothetical protein